MNPEIEALKRQVALLQRRLDRIDHVDRMTFIKPIVSEGGGLKLGKSTYEKIGFFGYAPVAQYNGVTFNSTAGATYTNTERNIINGMESALLSYGFIHS